MSDDCLLCSVSVCQLIQCQINVYHFISILAKLPGVAREKRHPLQEVMTSCNAQSSFSRAMATSCPTAGFTKTFIPYEGTYVGI